MYLYCSGQRFWCSTVNGRALSIVLLLYEQIHSTKDLYYRGAGKSLAQPTSRFILFDGENISFDVVLLYI